MWGVYTVRVPPKFLIFQTKSKISHSIWNFFSNILYIKLKVFKRPFRNWKQFYNWLKCWWVIRIWKYIHFSDFEGALEQHGNIPKKNFSWKSKSYAAPNNPWKFQFIPPYVRLFQILNHCAVDRRQIWKIVDSPLKNQAA